MSYEDAPTTQALATRCLICARPLRDAVSVEAGVGPDCREKIGMVVNDANRAQVNKLIHACAVDAERGNWESLQVHAGVAASLGYPGVAERIMSRFPEHFVAAVLTPLPDGRLKIVARYNVQSNPYWRRIGANWHKEDKCRYVQNTTGMKVEVLKVLRQFFPGEYAIGCKGLFKIKPEGAE